MPSQAHRFAISGLAALTAACATKPTLPSVTPTANFEVSRDLVGSAVGRGRVTSITGVDRSFTVHLDGRWDGPTQTLTLIEDFFWDDGEQYRRTWQLSQRENGQWAGGREDTVGTAVGFHDGHVFRLNYKLRLASGMVVTLRDVFVATPDGHVVNRATISKFGLRVGAVELDIRPRAQDAEPTPDLSSERSSAQSSVLSSAQAR